MAVIFHIFIHFSTKFIVYLHIITAKAVSAERQGQSGKGDESESVGGASPFCFPWPVKSALARGICSVFHRAFYFTGQLLIWLLSQFLLLRWYEGSQSPF
jgi:hypothetical protein